MAGAVTSMGGWHIVAWHMAGRPIAGQPRIISPLHGRSEVVRAERVGFVSIKGLGWTRGPCQPSVHQRMPNYTLGSFQNRTPCGNGFLHERHIGATRVLGYARNTSSVLTSGLAFFDGSPIHPCLLYTQSILPYRVADLPWLSDAERTVAIEEVASYRQWPVGSFTEMFCKQMLQAMADYHRHGCINDTLSADNITLAAEITDFEWFTTPEHKLPDGSQYEECAERRKKEIIYAYEIGCLHLRCPGSLG